MAELDFAAVVAAAAEEMRRKAKHTEVITEALPAEVKMVIDQMLMTIKDHERRIVTLEAFQSELTREATHIVKAA